MEYYIPKVGDVIKWLEWEYFVIESGDIQGVCCPVGENYYVRNFSWNAHGHNTSFVRLATKEELEKLGITIA